MTDLRVVASDGSEAILEATVAQGLADSLRGRLLRCGEGGYEEARKVWNGMIDRRPALIARCAGPADVVAAVRFARTHRLLLSVKGGGHNITGNAVCEGGLMIDLSPMKSVRVDPAGHTARAEAGLTWGEYNRETQAFGLASTGGVVSTTGIAGLTLGGGLGWLMGKHGLSCDNLISADLVTAEGELLTASAERHPELFWGLRGGGGNFGVVTSFEYKLHPVGPVLAGMVLHPMAKAKEVLRFYRDFARNCPDEALAAAALMTSPEGEPVVAIIVSYIGDSRTGEAVLAPLRKFGSPLLDTIAPTSYVQLNTLFDAAVPYGGVQRYWKSSFLSELGDELLGHHDRALGKDAVADVDGPVFSHARCRDPGRSKGDRLRAAPRPMGLRRDLAVERSRRDRRPHSVDAGVLDRGRAVRHRRSLCQPPRRRGRHADQGRLQRQLRAARRTQKQIRPDKPVPPQPEHQADDVGGMAQLEAPAKKSRNAW